MDTSKYYQTMVDVLYKNPHHYMSLTEIVKHATLGTLLALYNTSKFV